MWQWRSVNSQKDCHYQDMHCYPGQDWGRARTSISGLSCLLSFSSTSLYFIKFMEIFILVYFNKICINDLLWNTGLYNLQVSQVPDSVAKAAIFILLRQCIQIKCFQTPARTFHKHPPFLPLPHCIIITQRAEQLFITWDCSYLLQIIIWSH